MTCVTFYFFNIHSYGLLSLISRFLPFKVMIYWLLSVEFCPFKAKVYWLLSIEFCLLKTK